MIFYHDIENSIKIIIFFRTVFRPKFYNFKFTESKQYTFAPRLRLYTNTFRCVSKDLFFLKEFYRLYNTIKTILFNKILSWYRGKN